MNESCHIWMSHVTYERVMSHMNESCHIWMSHVKYESVMSHMNESCLTYKWVMSHMNVWNESCRRLATILIVYTMTVELICENICQSRLRSAKKSCACGGAKRYRYIFVCISIKNKNHARAEKRGGTDVFIFVDTFEKQECACRGARRYRYSFYIYIYLHIYTCILEWFWNEWISFWTRDLHTHGHTQITCK